MSVPEGAVIEQAIVSVAADVAGLVLSAGTASTSIRLPSGEAAAPAAIADAAA